MQRPTPASFSHIWRGTTIFRSKCNRSCMLSKKFSHANRPNKGRAMWHHCCAWPNKCCLQASVPLLEPWQYCLSSGTPELNHALIVFLFSCKTDCSTAGIYQHTNTQFLKTTDLSFLTKERRKCRWKAVPTPLNNKELFKYDNTLTSYHNNYLASTNLRHKHSVLTSRHICVNIHIYIYIYILYTFLFAAHYNYKR